MEKEITVADASAGRRDEPFDLGDIQLQLMSHVALGKPVPELNCVDGDGKPVKLADFHGKYILFCITDGEDPRDQATVREAHIFDRLGSDSQLAMLVIYTGDDFDAARKEADASGIRWPMVHL